MASLDEGRSGVLALSKEMKAELLLLDEEKAQNSSVMAGFNVMGLLGILPSLRQTPITLCTMPYALCLIHPAFPNPKSKDPLLFQYFSSTFPVPFRG
jgi:predicted nucleic acid-binding protein